MDKIWFIMPYRINTDIVRRRFDTCFLSSSFTLGELFGSNRADKEGICNIPTDTNEFVKVFRNGRMVARNILQHVRDKYNRVDVSSWHRCIRLNSMLGGAPFSQHITAEAVDWSVPKRKMMPVIFDDIVQGEFQDIIDFDQMIYEVRGKTIWIHSSFSQYEGRNRGQVLVSSKPGSYVPYLGQHHLEDLSRL